MNDSYASVNTVDDYRDTPMARTVRKVPKHEDIRNSDGVLRVYTRVNVVNIFGRDVSKRVSLGTDWNITLDTAREMVNQARAANSADIQAEFRVNL